MDAIKNNKNAKFGLVALATVLVVGILAWAFIIPPSAEKVCGHGYELMEKYAEDKDLDIEDIYDDKDEFMEECVEADEKATEDKSRSEVRSYRKCLLDTKDLDDMDKCEKELK